MIERLLELSIRFRMLVIVAGMLIAVAGLYAATQLSIDAVPDITSNQVQINTLAPAFAPEEMEKYVTFPIEVALGSLPRKQDIRSISQFGLSQVTVTFAEDVDPYWARQLVLERLAEAERELPPGVAPELGPVSTGLGEIYQFSVERRPGSTAPGLLPASMRLPGTAGAHELMDLRTVLDWIIKPQLRTVPGVIEVNSFGGHERQYEVLVDPARLVGYKLTLRQVIEALARNNANAGGATLERGGEQQLLRGIGLIGSIADIENIVVKTDAGTPVRVRDVATVGVGSQLRQGAATRDGRGETVMGMAMLLKGENSGAVAARVRARLDEVQKALPPNVVIRPFYDRTSLVKETVKTATRNLLEGGLLVIGVLFLFLMQIRAGLIVSSAIPLSMLMAIIGMSYFKVSANLMSLGAIDFGLIVDGAVIIVENTVRRLAVGRHQLGRALSAGERLGVTRDAAKEVLTPALVGMVIIIAAYMPILTLSGIEGKMFRPMAFTVILALAGALVLSLTLIPALAAAFLRNPARERVNPAVEAMTRWYNRVLNGVMRRRRLVTLVAVTFLVVCGVLFTTLGAEFLPELDEGALAINHVRLKSVSLTEAVRQANVIEAMLLQNPEVSTTVSRIGRPEIATDPMGPDMADTYAFLKPRSEWRPGLTKEALVSAISEQLAQIPGVSSSISQPIKFRMMELIEGVGVRSDVAVKIFGDDMNVLLREANKVAAVVRQVRGAADVKVQQVAGLPVLQIRIDRAAIARHGINIADVQEVIQSAIAGTEATTVLEGFMRFALMVRFPGSVRSDPASIGNLLVAAPGGENVPLAQIAQITNEEGPAEIARENGQRRITVEVNVRGRDIGSVVDEARARVDQAVHPPAGYLMSWGGMYEHLESGRQRLMVVVPATFLVIFLLLFTAFNSLRQAAIVFTGIPFAISGGILALVARSMPFSMSAGVGFIALFGVAVLNGVVMMTFINQLRARGSSVVHAVREGAVTRLRPVLMTALVAGLGFLPMALSHGTGAEVQRPLATVVIGGLITSTVLTLLLLPMLYGWFEHERPEVQL